MQRRSFLSGILAAAAAPAIVKAGGLMSIWMPKWYRGGVADPVVWRPGCSIGKTEAFDEFTLAQIRLIANSMGLPFEEMAKPVPEMQVVYSSARVALLEQFSKTSSIRPIDVRSNHGQFPS